jgi:hypothetical protein
MQSLTFTQQLILTIADKLLIAAALVLVGYWLNKRLEQFKSHEAEKLQVLKGQQDGLIAIFKAQQDLALEMRREQQALAKELRDLQVQKELQMTAQIASARLPAYAKLWEIQNVVSPTLKPELSPQQRKDLETNLRAAFFQNGNGIFLSHSAFTRYRDAMKSLQDETSTSQQIVSAFSALRTQLKLDVRIYNEEEAMTPTAPKPRNTADAKSA